MTWEQPQGPGPAGDADPYFPPPPPPPGASAPLPPAPLPPAAFPPPAAPPAAGRSRVQDTPRDGRPAYGTPAPVTGRTLTLPEGAEYASWASRAGAALLDGLVVSALLVPILVVFGVLNAVTEHPPPDPDGTEHASDIASAVLLLLLFGQLCFWAWNCWRAGSRGQSLGKQWVGIHLVGDRSGRPPGGWAGLGKGVLRGILTGATLGLYGLLTLLWPLWDVRRQTLDDKLVNTVVLRFPGTRLG